MILYHINNIIVVVIGVTSLVVLALSQNDLFIFISDILLLPISYHMGTYKHTQLL